MPLVIDRLRDDLRAASGRWTAGANVFTTMSNVDRRRHLGYHPGPDEPSLKRREGMSRLTRLNRDTVPPVRPASDLRSRKGRNYVSAVGERTRAGTAKTIVTVVESTLRVTRDNPALEVVVPPELDLLYARARREPPRLAHYAPRATHRASARAVGSSTDPELKHEATKPRRSDQIEIQV